MTHPIEEESYRILAGRVDLDAWAPGPRAVIARVIHASADVDLARSMVVDEAAVAAGVTAVEAQARAIADVEMVRAGITAYPTTCLVRDAEAGRGGFPTRSAMAVRAAAARHADGAIWVVGCAPTALQELVHLIAAGTVRPALVIGLPVGFVGAADAKAALRQLDVPAISNTGEKGGSAVAAAAFNALVRLSSRGG
jgi:precorrin-8X/cobalt-precorrin-8 methylmutase